MKFKKIMSLALALIMATALCVPALASAASADSSSTTQTSDMTGSTKVGTIDLTVDSASGIVFNPSKIYVNVTTNYTVDASNTNADSAVNNQIIAKTVKITNKTDVPLNMTATLGIKINDRTTGTKATVATAAPNDNQTAKQIMLTADFAVFDNDNPDNLRDDNWLTASKLVAAAATRATTGEQAITGGKSHTAAQAVKIPAAASSSPNYVFVKFDGAATKAPTTPWDDDDTFDVYTTYKFLPQSTPERRVLAVVKPLASNQYPALGTTDGPDILVSYMKDTPGYAETSGTITSLGFPAATGGTNICKNASGYNSDNYVWPGFTVMIKPRAATGTNAGKYYAVTNVLLYDENGTASTVRATKVGNKTDAYWTFAMPDAHTICTVTYSATPS